MNNLLIEILLILAIIFFMVRSILLERNHKKKGPYITIGVFSNMAIFNVIVVIFLGISSFVAFKDTAENASIWLYILIPILFIIYQIYLSLKFVFCQDGVCYLGQFFDYKIIKQVQIIKVKDKFKFIIYTNRSNFNFKVNKSNKDLAEASFKKFRVKISK
ncbi:DUF986 family protein [Clostridium sp. Ade.TY]|uniref:DUF986 family protein n=1 Tax=Clostridium sp. Ade.TY TaxID=1391647 RepID=UPI0004282651|nr:DUF986 family protein [Clostridium sp. Ade.TY]